MKRVNLSLLLSLTAVLALFVAASLLLSRYQQTRGALNGLPPLDSPERVPILGVNVDLRQYDQVELAENLEEIAATGFIWVRQTFDWGEIEATRGAYEWESSDTIVKAVADQGLQLVAVLQGSPDYVAAAPGAPPDHQDEFGAFAKAFAERYADQIEVYQVWDEPNLAAGWDGQAADPVAYAALLEAAYTAIHAADVTSFVLAAGLAPTIEKGPANLSDITFLDELYKNGAAPFFDGAAGKPYGFDSGPEDRAIHENELNFSRFLLLRAVMEKHGDAGKPLWASHFGWNSLPPDWSGSPSLWGQTSAETQAAWTVAAYQRALQEWPWTGALILESWQPSAGEDDPRWGFALKGSDGSLSPTAAAITDLSPQINATLWPGVVGVDNSHLRYSGEWEVSELGADFVEGGGSVVELPFTGDTLAVIARRGNYRAHLYVDVDGEPSTLLPRDSAGRTYLILTDPDYRPRVEMLPVASGDGESIHQVRLEADRGWDQWALVGFAVGRKLNTLPLDLGIAISALIALCAAFFSIRLSARAGWRAALERSASWLKDRLSAGLHQALALLAGITLWFSAALTWGGLLPDLLRRAGDGPSLLLTALTAGVFYFSPWLILTLLALTVLFLLIYARPYTGIALLMFFTPYIFFPRQLFDRALSMVEMISLLLFFVWLIRITADRKEKGWPSPGDIWQKMTSLDKAVAGFLLIGIISISWANLKGVAITDLRQMMVEPLIIYLILRTIPFTKAERWQIVDLLILTGAIAAIIGFYQAISGVDLIIAEGSSHRLRSVFGTPNNAALYFERLIPITAAVAVIKGGDQRRRWLYGLAAVLILGATILTMSKGAILLGIPVSLGLILILYLGKKGLYIVGVGVLLIALSLIPLSQIPRFASLFNFSEGSSFFRINLWRSTFSLLKDHPLTGVGLDQFLYAYRGHYIQPQAWQQPDLSQPHNFLLNYWVRLGIFGLIVGVYIQVAFWKLGMNLHRRLKAGMRGENWPLVVGLLGSMAAMLSHGLVDETHFVIDLAFIFYLTLGLIWQISVERPANE